MPKCFYHKTSFAEREKKSSKGKLNEEVKRCHASQSTASKTTKKSNKSIRNNAMQEFPNRPSTRFNTLDCEPRCLIELPENNNEVTKFQLDV